MFVKYIAFTILLLAAAFLGRFAIEYRDVVTLPDGSGQRTSPGVGGFVDTVAFAGGELRLTGWAGDLKANRPAAKAIVFLGSRELFSIEVGQPRDDVAAVRKTQAMLPSGFSGAVALNGPLDGAGLRVFARTQDGRLGELRLTGAAKAGAAEIR